MHPADITAALKKKGSSQSDVARKVVGRNGRPVTASAVHLVIKGATRSQTIASAISRQTGLRVAELWPGAYPTLEMLERRARAAAAAKKVAA